jgi:Arc/MetJ-type ribon-helix-helix transcriptional regulator
MAEEGQLEEKHLLAMLSDMARVATIRISLTPTQLRRVKQRVDSGMNGSTSEVIQEGLRLLFGKPASSRQFRRHLAAGYRATFDHDRKLAAEWAKLSDPWPEE